MDMRRRHGMLYVMLETESALSLEIFLTLNPGLYLENAVSSLLWNANVRVNLRRCIGAKMLSEYMA